MADRVFFIERPFIRSPHWPGPEFFIALVVIGLFAFAFQQDPTDDTMKGALIAGFAGAWGFFLGSSSGAKRANARADQAADTVSIMATAAASPMTRTTTERIESGPGAAADPPEPETAASKRAAFRENWEEK